MKAFASLVTCCLVALGLTACGDVREVQGGTAWCFNCHSETTPLGLKIKWAEAGWVTSVHAQGQVERDYAQIIEGGCPAFDPGGVATSQCTAQGGTFSNAAHVCTMPATTTPAACATAGGTWNPPELDATVVNGRNAGQCPQFRQPVAAAGTAQACTQAGPGFGGTYTAGTFTCDTTNIHTQNGCETAGGVWVGPKFVLSGAEHAGTNAFYANSGGCQMCHTQEGFRKRVAGAYDTASYSIRFGWSTQAWVGSPTTTPNTPLTADVIVNPSPIGCFGCHTPHGIGTADNLHLDQTVPVGTPITTQTGAVWGANKAKGNICAECHQVRLNNQPSVSASIDANIATTAVPPGRFSVSAPYGPHHGPQTDMNLGFGGAQYAGTTATGFTFNGSYGNSAHTSNVNADCISCHMQSDFEDINVTGSFGVDAAVGGHAFTNKAFVHGSEKVLALGCGSVTNGVGCHTTPGVATSTGTLVRPANVTQTNGYLQLGDAYFQKSTNPNGTTMTDSNYQYKMNALLTKLANPSARCTGLLQDAVAAAGGALSWATMADPAVIDPRCIFNGTTTGINKAAAATVADDNTNASVRFLKGLWNFKFALVEDKSFGVHNTTYALELLYDSCTDLALLTGKACGPNAGRCSYCEDPVYVPTRP